MDFLKKHYEKLALIVLFVIFMLVLVLLVGIVKDTKEITADDLQLPKSEANYEKVKVNADDDIFKLDKVFSNIENWKSTELAKNSKLKERTGLLYMFPAARCGHDDCKYIIPLSVLKNGEKCPICGKELIKFTEVIIKDAKGNIVRDSDRDGIPDIDEVELGLNPNYRLDAMEDLDGDGFVNIFEYQQKTDLKDALSHPALHLGLTLDKLERQLLPVELKGVTEETEDKKNWTVQIYTEPVRRGGRVVIPEKNTFTYIGGEFRILNKLYKVKDISSVMGKVIEQTSTGEKEVDGKIYTVTVTDFKNREIKMHTNIKEVWSPDDRAFFNYAFDKKKNINGVNGNIFVLGNKNIGFDKYKIVEIISNQRNPRVAIINSKNPEKKLIINRNKKVKDGYYVEPVEDNKKNDMQR